MSFERARAREIDYLVAVVGDRPVGHLGIDFTRKADQDVAVLWQFGVEPLLQRRGIGTRMILEGETRIRAHGAPIAEIAVETDNLDARRLYERLGYTEVSDQPDDEVVLRKRL